MLAIEAYRRCVGMLCADLLTATHHHRCLPFNADVPGVLAELQDAISVSLRMLST